MNNTDTSTALRLSCSGGRRRHRGVALIAGLALTAAAATGCECLGAPMSDDLSSIGDPPPPTTFKYTGAVQTYQVPDNAVAIAITAAGGVGGLDRDSGVGNPTVGAVVDGTVAVQGGETPLISVGGKGADASGGDHDPQGGWGGLGAHGGNGNSASDTLRTSGAGGGASTVQLADSNGGNPRTLLIAGGGTGASGTSGGGGGGAGSSAVYNLTITSVSCNWNGPDASPYAAFVTVIPQNFYRPPNQ